MHTRKQLNCNLNRAQTEILAYQTTLLIKNKNKNKKRKKEKKKKKRRKKKREKKKERGKKKSWGTY